MLRQYESLDDNPKISSPLSDHDGLKNVSLASIFHSDTNLSLEKPMKLSKSRRWHPRISTYRFIVFTTTVALGTAKAVVVLNGGSSTPTTLEWIGGTFLSILFFSVSAYDTISADHRLVPPSWLKWLFSPDCMDVTWSLLSTFLIPRPHYISDEKVASLSNSQPPITAYHILVCTVVIAFSVAKATLSYQNVSSCAVPYLDWALAVPIFSILYCLGLYEYNSADLWPSFFAVNRSDIIFSLNTEILHLIALLFCAAWVYALRYVTTMFSYQPSLRAELLNTGIGLETTFYKLLGHEFLLAGMMAGTLTFLFITRKALFSLSRKTGIVRRAARIMRRAIFSVVRQRPTPDDRKDKEHEIAARHQAYNTEANHSAPYGVHITDPFEFALRILIHLSTYTFGVAVCLTFLLPGSPFFSFAFDTDALYSCRRTSILTCIIMGTSSTFASFISVAILMALAIYAPAMAVFVVEPLYYLYQHGAGKGLGERIDMVANRLVGLGPFQPLL